MKLASLIVGLVLIANSAQAKDRYLVQFKSSQGFAAMKSYFVSTESAAPNLQKSLDNVGVMVLKTKNISLLNSLKNHPEVLSVEAERFFPAPKPVNGWKPAKVVYFESSFRKKKPATLAGIPDFKQGPATPWGILAVNAGSAWQQSAAGQNARVLVLDTGVDANHPAIAPNFEKGRNFTENVQGQTDEAGFQDEEGHGTHCSGTIAGAYNAETGFTGVAPKAKLLMGKVCAAEGCSTVAVVEGINWGIQEKVDVISMSLGGPVGSSAERTAVANAEKAGVVVVAASGNGADDPNYSQNKSDPKCGGGGAFFGNSCGVSFPAAFQTVIAVGALNDQLAKTSFSQWGPELDVTAPGAAVVSSVPMGTGRESKVKITVNGATREVLSSAFGGTELVPNAVVKDLVAVPGLGKPEDFAQVNVSGKFALVKRGEIKFAEKVKNAIDAGAVGVVIYNHSPGLMQGSLSEDGSLIPYPVVMVEKTTGEALVAELARGATVATSIKLGPSDYASFDGTSMATPHVAGVVALIRSANKRLTPAQVRTLLSGTAKALAPNDTNQFGAGIVQADAAVRRAVGQ